MSGLKEKKSLIDLDKFIDWERWGSSKKNWSSCDVLDRMMEGVIVKNKMGGERPCESTNSVDRTDGNNNNQMFNGNVINVNYTLGAGLF